MSFGRSELLLLLREFVVVELLKGHDSALRAARFACGFVNLALGLALMNTGH